MPTTHHLNSWFEISESAYAQNLGFFRERVGDRVELSVAVKANAYGHGMEQIAELALRYGANSFCVHSLEEALRLRRAGFEQDILMMGHVPLARLEEVVREDFRLVLYNLETARELTRLTQAMGRSVRVHLKVETGTHRQGINAADLPHFAEYLKEHPTLRPEGVYTHFANIEDTTRHEYALHQLERFEDSVERLHKAGLEVPKRHAACSAAALLFPKTHFDMVRLGVSQYGIWSSEETFLSYQLERQMGTGGKAAIDTEAGSEEMEVLHPVLTWKARISQVKDVPADAFIGYGCSYQTTRATRIAVLPVGYYDGYDRQLSNRAWVLIHGRRAPVRGRICMNLILVDVTDIPAAGLEDEAVLLGRQGDQKISASQLGDLAGTIPYEILARLNPELPRLIVE